MRNKIFFLLVALCSVTTAQNVLWKKVGNAIYPVDSTWNVIAPDTFYADVAISRTSSGPFGHWGRNLNAGESGTVSPATATDTGKAAYFNATSSFFGGAAGTASSPSFSISGQTGSMGMFPVGTVDLGFATGGTRVFRVNTTNLVPEVNLVPNLNEVYNLGSTTLNWNTGYLKYQRVSSVGIDADVTGHGVPRIFSVSNQNEVNFSQVRVGAGTPGSLFWGFKTRADSTNANTIVQNGDQTLELTGFLADGVSYIRSAKISFEVDGVPGTNDAPGRIVFLTTPDGEFLPTEKARITASGNFGLGSTLPLHKITSGSSYSTNLNGFNFVNSNFNTNLSTVAEATDTSSVNLSFSGSGTPTFSLTNAVGATQFKSDSVGATIGGALTAGKYTLSAFNTAPVGPAAPGTLGEIRYTTDTVYVCTTTNTWKKWPINSY